MSFEINGYEILDDFISEDLLHPIKAELNSLSSTELKAGIRNADKKFQSIHQLINSSLLLSRAAYYLCQPAKVVRVILFDKTPENNRLVSWHQDKTVSVSEKIEMENWGSWSLKDGVNHVQPSVEVLNRMVTFRIHLDDSTIENGCLRIIPKSHRRGILSNDHIQEIISTQTGVNCEGKSGTILVMKPHLLHASSKAVKPGQRRIVHVEYSSYELPHNMTWVSS